MGMKESAPHTHEESPTRLPAVGDSTRKSMGNLSPSQSPNRTGIPGHQVLSLDKNCLTCSNGGVPFAMNAFKIACLSYQPSVVQFE
jgi:hypothetical protein